jgi:hypothetical protein
MTKLLWFTVNRDGRECVHNRKPIRHRGDEPIWVVPNSSGTGTMTLPPGSIWEITGKTLSWENDPIQWSPKNLPQDKEGKHYEQQKAH